MFVRSSLLVALGLLWAPPAHASCFWPEVALDLGVGLENTTLSTLRPVGLLGVRGGWDLNACLGWPVRGELGIGASTRGPPWYQGVEAVAVRAFEGDIWLVAGVSFALVESRDGKVRFGLDALAGPDLRVNIVAVRVQHQERTSIHPEGIGRVVAGMFLGFWGWRVTLRADWPAPQEPGLTVGVGYQF